MCVWEMAGSREGRGVIAREVRERSRRLAEGVRDAGRDRRRLAPAPSRSRAAARSGPRTIARQLTRLGRVSAWSELPWIPWDRDVASFAPAVWLTKHTARARMVLRSSNVACQLTAAATGLGVGLFPLPFVPRARSAMGRASVPLDGYAETMADANLADPEFEPSDEQLGELFRRAFSEVNSKHRESLARLRAEIARLRVEARRRVAGGPR